MVAHSQIYLFCYERDFMSNFHKSKQYDLNIKIISGVVHTSVYDKRDDFGFPIVNFPWLSGDVPRLPS